MPRQTSTWSLACRVFLFHKCACARCCDGHRAKNRGASSGLNVGISPALSNSGNSLTYWPAVHNTTVTPLCVQAALEFHGSVHADITLEAFAIVTDLCDDVVRPVIFDPKAFAHFACHTQNTLNIRII